MSVHEKGSVDFGEVARGSGASDIAVAIGAVCLSAVLAGGVAIGVFSDTGFGSSGVLPTTCCDSIGAAETDFV